MLGQLMLKVYCPLCQMMLLNVPLGNRYGDSSQAAALLVCTQLSVFVEDQAIVKSCPTTAGFGLTEIEAVGVLLAAQSG